MSDTNPAPVNNPPADPPAPTPPAPPAPAPAPTPPAPPAVNLDGLGAQLREAIGSQTETIINGVREAVSSIAPSAPAPGANPAPTNDPAPAPPSTAPAGAARRGPSKFAKWFFGMNDG